MQTTIRSTDIKSGLLMTALVIPLANFKDLSHFYTILKTLADKYPISCGYWFPCLIFVLSCLCFIMWISALFSILRVIYPATQGNTAIETETSKLDCFFLGGTTIQEATSVLAAIEQARANLPKSDEDLISSLLFEQVKLAKLRSRKLRGLKLSIIVIGMLIFCIMLTVFIFYCFSN